MLGVQIAGYEEARSWALERGAEGRCLRHPEGAGMGDEPDALADRDAEDAAEELLRMVMGLMLVLVEASLLILMMVSW